MNTKTIALCGTMGSGKSSVAKLLSQNHGIETFDTDSKAKEILFNPNSFESIIEILGNEVLVGSMLNTQKIAELIFTNITKKTKLEEYIHPKVWEWIKEQVHISTSPYCAIESALLVQTGTYKKFDVLVAITSPFELQLKRLVGKRLVDENDARRRLHLQHTCNITSMADYILKNNGTYEDLTRKVDVLHCMITKGEL